MQPVVEEDHIHQIIHSQDLPNNNNSKTIHINNNQLDNSNNQGTDGLNNNNLIHNNLIGTIQVSKHKFLMNFLECKIKQKHVVELVSNMIL